MKRLQRPAQRARARLPLTEERKRAFLEHLATYGIAAEAARAASPGCPTGAMATFKDARRRDPEFAKAWEEAAEQARGVIEAEIRRRAIEGWEEPGRHGPVRKYSDRLLELMARARLPEYRDRRKVEVSGDATVPDEPIGLDQLSTESLLDLERILEREARCKDLGPGEAADATPSNDTASARRAEVRQLPNLNDDEDRTDAGPD